MFIFIVSDFNDNCELFEKYILQSIYISIYLYFLNKPNTKVDYCKYGL